MNAVEQPSLTLRLPADDVDRVTSLSSFEKVMSRLIEENFDSDKDACRHLKIDPAIFSKRKNAQASWSVVDMRKLMEHSQTMAPLAWLARQYGYRLVLLETEAERQLREAREENARLRAEAKVRETFLRNVLVGQATA